MMLGKRGRGPMKRTTSMSDINFDLNMSTNNNNTSGGLIDLKECKVLGTVSGMKHRRNFSDLAPITDFLRSCSFCTRPLLHGRDIYMYRGDSGFCSLECREKQMKQDQIKEKQVTKAL